MEKYIILCIAGQSNALGYDESPITKEDLYCTDPKRIKQLGFYKKDNLKIIPLGYCAHSMQDLRLYNRPGSDYPGTKGLPLPLGNLLLPHIPEDYGLLFLSIAYGGTAFTAGEDVPYDPLLKKPALMDEHGQCGPYRWGKDTAYYHTLKDRILYALQLHPENRFAGLIWCQGENDSENSKGHYSAFCTMTERLFSELNSAGMGNRVSRGQWDKNIWYNMETVFHWYHIGECRQIWDNYKSWNPPTYISIPRTTSSNSSNGTGQTASIRDAHFGNNAYREIIAPLVLDKLLGNKALHFQGNP